MAHFQIQNLSFSYPAAKGKKSLDGICLQVEKGEYVVLCGASGSGKTTLLRCLNFLETADEGEIWVKDKPLFVAGTKYTDDQIRENRLHFGLVFQNFNLFPQYTALQNVTLARELMSKESGRVKIRCCIILVIISSFGRISMCKR